MDEDYPYMLQQRDETRTNEQTEENESRRDVLPMAVYEAVARLQMPATRETNVRERVTDSTNHIKRRCQRNSERFREQSEEQKTACCSNSTYLSNEIEKKPQQAKRQCSVPRMVFERSREMGGRTIKSKRSLLLQNVIGKPNFHSECTHEIRHPSQVSSLLSSSSKDVLV